LECQQKVNTLIHYNKLWLLKYYNLYIIYSKYITPIKLQCSFAFLDSRYVTLVGTCWNGTGKSKEKVNSLESYQVQIQSKLNQKH